MIVEAARKMYPELVIVPPLDAKGEEVGYFRELVQEIACSSVRTSMGRSSHTVCSTLDRFIKWP